MITSEDKAFLLALIDINKAIAENDTALAASVCETVNAMELTEDQANSINDSVVMEQFQESNAGCDAYKTLVEDLNCIRDRAYKLFLLDANMTLHTRDKNAINDFLDNRAMAGLDIDTEANQLFCARVLIHMCFVAKRYDKMEKIREKVKEMG